MKIALFTIHNILACHYALFGYRETLQRMGHEVIECAFPGNQVNTQGVSFPPIEVLKSCDLVLSTYHEYVQPWLEQLYIREEWFALMKKVPVLARFDESMDRSDLQLPARVVPKLLKWATHYSFPAAQDAEKYKGEWLPYGADLTVFHSGLSYDKKFDVAFVGTLYPKRHEYLNKLAPLMGGATFYSGNVFVQDLDGINEKDTFGRLALNYGRIKIFFCLPPQSNLIVEKIVDVMACDTMVMYPRLYGAAAKNLSQFEDGVHIVYYELGFFANNGKQVKYYLEHPEEITRIAKAGGERVRTLYTLERMMQAMLDQAAVPARL